jgi:hypothetical protein
MWPSPCSNSSSSKLNRSNQQHATQQWRNPVVINPATIMPQWLAQLATGGVQQADQPVAVH